MDKKIELLNDKIELSEIERIQNQFQRNLDIVSNFKGKRCNPREWFIVPIRVVEQAIEMIINGNIVDYRYDVDSRFILKR